jgi:hypothetical protein
MPKARSLTGRTEAVKRWKVYADGRVEDPHGHIHSELPVEIAYSAQCVNLVAGGHLEIEGVYAGLAPKSKAPAEPVAKLISESEVLETNGSKKKGKRHEPHDD